jgi:hypothetical protein
LADRLPNPSKGEIVRLQEVAANAKQTVEKGAHQVARFAKLERVLALLCLSIPLLLVIFDSSVRESISAYYDMDEAQIFYFPLTVAAMLFIVNGVIKHRHFYNTLLGIALSGVILFNLDDSTIVHYIFAAAFFIGNGLVVLISAKISKRAKWFYSVGIGLPLILSLGFDLVSLFWAEWLSFFIITVHYLADSIDSIMGKAVTYKAVQPTH